MAKDKDYWSRWDHYQKYGTWPASDTPKSPKQFKKNPGFGNSGSFDQDGNPPQRPSGGSRAPKKPKGPKPKSPAAAAPVQQPTLF